MKKILLLSDTHSYIDDRILAYAAEADEVWHAGDIGLSIVTDRLQAIKPLRAVFGNIDGTEIRKEFPLHQRFLCEGVDVWITHIGGYPGRYSPAVREEIKANPPRLFICGHSHILKVMNDKSLNLLHMNPGAAGIHGFHKLRTMLRFTIDGSTISELEVVELENGGDWKLNMRGDKISSSSQISSHQQYIILSGRKKPGSFHPGFYALTLLR